MDFELSSGLKLNQSLLRQPKFERLTITVMITDQGPSKSAPTIQNKQTSILELSVVMPCLNESETLAACIEKATRSLRENSIDGEIVIADNGSTDGSQKLA